MQCKHVTGERHKIQIWTMKLAYHVLYNYEESKVIVVEINRLVCSIYHLILQYVHFSVQAMCVALIHFTEWRQKMFHNNKLTHKICGGNKNLLSILAFCQISILLCAHDLLCDLCAEEHSPYIHLPAGADGGCSNVEDME